MPGIKRRRSKTNFAPTRKGRVKLIFEMRAIKRTYGRKTSNRPSGRRRFCGVQAFSPKAETLAQAEFTAQPLAALPPYGCGVPLAGASAKHSNHEGRRPPPAAGTQKERHDQRSCLSWMGRLKSIFLNREKCRPQGGPPKHNPAKWLCFGEEERQNE